MLSIFMYFKMEMHAGRVARAAHHADLVALLHLIALADTDRAKMCIQGLITVPVIDDDDITVALL